MFERRMLLHEIVGYRVEVVDGITDRRLIADSQHPYVHLLRQVRCIGFAADSLSKKRLQRRPMLGEQPLHERRLWGQLPTCPRMKLFPIFYMSPVRPKRTPLIDRKRTRLKNH